MEVKNNSKYFFIGILLGLLVLSFFLIKPYIIAILGGCLLGYIFYPVYKRLNRLIKNEYISSFLISFLVIIILVLPVVFVGNAVINESVQFFYYAKNIDLGEISDKISEYMGGNINLDGYLRDMLNRLSIAVLQNTSDFIFSLPDKLIGLFITLFTMFYLFIDGPKLYEKIQNELPIKEQYKKILTKKFDDVTYAVIYGIVITAIIQGIVGAIGLWIFDVPSVVLWGIVMTILAMLPFLGPFLVWLPAAAIKLINGDFFNGFGLIIYGLLIVSTIDNIIRPKIISRRAQVHPLLILVGVLGGLQVFGIFGIIIGPLCLSILMVFIEVYLIEKNNRK